MYIPLVGRDGRGQRTKRETMDTQMTFTRDEIKAGYTIDAEDRLFYIMGADGRPRRQFVKAAGVTLAAGERLCTRREARAAQDGIVFPLSAHDQSVMDAQAALEALPGVWSTRRYVAPGKNRLYITFCSFQARTCALPAEYAAELTPEGCSIEIGETIGADGQKGGSATWHRHAELGTAEAVRAIIAGIVPPVSL